MEESKGGGGVSFAVLFLFPSPFSSYSPPTPTLDDLIFSAHMAAAPLPIASFHCFLEGRREDSDEEQFVAKPFSLSLSIYIYIWNENGLASRDVRCAPPAQAGAHTYVKI